MKKITLFFLICSQFLLSQTYEPAQYKFHWGTNGPEVYLSSDMDYFTQKNFLLGWHWGAERKISQALDANQIHGGRTPDTSQVVNNCLNTVNPDFYSHDFDLGIMNARGLQYEPTLTLDRNFPDKLTFRNGDSTRAIFGFLNRRGRIITDTTATNFSRLIIDGDSLNNQVILSEPWPSNELNTFGNNDFKKNPDDTVHLNNYFCRNLYFSMNLRRTGTLSNNDAVLKIELPYKVHNNSTQYLIRFKSIPSGSKNDTGISYTTLYRGRYQNTIPAPNNNTRAFYITKNILPDDGSDITISALFRCDGDTDIFFGQGNYLLKNLNPEDNKIDSLKISITYLGGETLMIDWVRFETPHCASFLSGDFDQRMIDDTQTDLNNYISSACQAKGYKLFRYNMVIEHKLENWIAEHYFNKLIGNIGSSEVEAYYPNHYEHYVNPPDRWLGDNKLLNNISVPYSRKVYDPTTENSIKTLGMFNGYMGMNNAQPETDSAKSHYETYLINQGTSVNINYFLQNPDSIKLYEQVVNFENNNWKASFQVAVEGLLFRYFFKSTSRGFLFSNKNWWHQSFIHTQLGQVYYPFSPPIGDDTFKFFGRRPFTGEEYRLFATYGVLLGAKGLLYDGAQSNQYDSNKLQFYDNAFLEPRVRDSLELLPDMTFLNSDVAGPDYFRPVGEIARINSRIYPLDSIAKYMNRPRDRIYFGRKSVRLEMKKLHDWIRANDSTLMRLKLAAWYAKGYRVWYFQDTARFGADTVLYKIIDSVKSKWLLRPIDRTKIDAGNIVADYEPWDSTFVDITLLRDSSDHNFKSNQFFMGVQNRRTSPLILMADSMDNVPSYKFYTTNEMDNLARNGGLTLNGQYHDTTWWRNKYWQRAGARELHIPFKFRNSSNADNYTLLHITELGKGTPLDTNWWFKAPYRHVIDTVIQRDSTLIVKLLPGEGKILRCQVLYSPDNYFTGYLDYSNQRKMVAYPDTQITRTQIPQDTARYRYHAVFFRVIPGDNRLGIYYRRSFPMAKNVDSNQINWEPINYLLSDTIIASNFFGFDTVKTRNCAYPAIVTRYDSVNQSIKVYVVYACENPYAAGDQSQVTIVENIFDANGVYTPYIKYGRQLATANCDTSSKIVRWGTPTINASFNGNYYAWSDSLVGIVAGFKRPDQYYLTTKDTIHYFEPSIRQIAQHPSLNTYSRLFSGETDCALVWQEKDKDSTDDYFNINYTRLRLDPAGRLMHYVPKRGCSYGYPVLALYKFDSTMIMIHDTSLQYQYALNKFMYPMVYRGVELGTQCCYANINACHGDMVFWQGKDWLNTDVIWIAGLQLLDTINAFTGEWMPDCWDLSCLSSIRSSDPTRRTSLFRPDAAQGCLRAVPPGEYNNKGDSLMVTNFVQMPDGQDVNPNGRIWQVISSYWGFFNDWQTLRGEFTDYKYARRIASKGQNPHLAALPMINNDSIWNRNRRIFEVQQYPENTNRIVTSLEWFYRNDGDETSSEPFFGYVHDSLKTMFSYPYMLDADGEISRPFIKPFELIGNTRMPLDTIYSDWFGVGDIKQMKIFGFSKNTELMSVYIQRMKDSKTFKLNTPIIGSKYVRNNYQLYNGGKHQYRLIFVKNIPDMSYTEDLVIGGFPDAKDFSDAVDSRFGRAVEKPSMQYVDLGEAPTATDGKNISLLAYPNPADDYILATAYISYNELISKQHKLLIKVVSVLGVELYRQEVKPGETIMLDTKDYQQGGYFIRAEEKTGNYLDDRLTPAIQGFVIKR